MRRLLFTGGGGAGCQSVYTQWRGRYDIYFADADLKAIHPDLPAVAVPYASDDRFAGAGLWHNDQVVHLAVFAH